MKRNQKQNENAESAARKVRFVYFSMPTRFIAYATEKALLIQIDKPDEQVDIWIPKSLIKVEQCEDDRSVTMCSLPYWKFKDSQLRQYFLPEKWIVRKI